MGYANSDTLDGIWCEIKDFLPAGSRQTVASLIIEKAQAELDIDGFDNDSQLMIDAGLARKEV